MSVDFAAPQGLSRRLIGPLSPPQHVLHRSLVSESSDGSTSSPGKQWSDGGAVVHRRTSRPGQESQEDANEDEVGPPALEGEYGDSDDEGFDDVGTSSGMGNGWAPRSDE